jgi:hypothetical protein
MKKIISSWLILRYILCSLIALWGFILIFKNGMNSGGKILLVIAFVGLIVTLCFDFINNKREKPVSSKSI